MYDSPDEDFVFFHSSFTQETSTLVIELVITRIQGHTVSHASGGYAICDVFKLPTAPQPVIVVKGTPRMIGAMSAQHDQKNRIGKTVLTFEIVKFPVFRALM